MLPGACLRPEEAAAALSARLSAVLVGATVEVSMQRSTNQAHNCISARRVVRVLPTAIVIVGCCALPSCSNGNSTCPTACRCCETATLQTRSTRSLGARAARSCYTKRIRQICVRELGHEEPTILLTKDQHSTLRKLLGTYWSSPPTPRVGHARAR